MNDSKQTHNVGKSNWYPPVISLTIIKVENGVFAAAAKKPAMPTSANAAGLSCSPGNIRPSTMPSAPPPQPPMTIEGPNTPPEPPLPIVKLVVRIFPNAIASSAAAVTLVESLKTC